MCVQIPGNVAFNGKNILGTWSWLELLWHEAREAEGDQSLRIQFQHVVGKAHAISVFALKGECAYHDIAKHEINCLGAGCVTSSLPRTPRVAGWCLCVIGILFLASGCQDLGPWMLHNKAYNAVTVCSALDQSLMLGWVLVSGQKTTNQTIFNGQIEGKLSICQWEKESRHLNLLLLGLLLAFQCKWSFKICLQGFYHVSAQTTDLSL